MPPARTSGRVSRRAAENDDDEGAGRRASGSTSRSQAKGSRRSRNDDGAEDRNDDDDEEDDEQGPTSTLTALLAEAKAPQPLDRKTGESRLRSLRADWTTAGDGAEKVSKYLQEAAERLADWCVPWAMKEQGGREHKHTDRLDHDLRKIIDARKEIVMRQGALDAMREDLLRGVDIMEADRSYADRVSTQLQEYGSKTSRQKYAKDASFRKFYEQISNVIPNATDLDVMDVLAAEAGDPDDDEAEIVSGVRHNAWKCPLTAKILEDPVASNVCAHAYERSAIMEILTQQGSVSCPASGCNKVLKVSDIREDAELTKEVRKHARRMKEKERARLATQHANTLEID